jgi:hypothetical protein
MVRPLVFVVAIVGSAALLTVLILMGVLPS